jgi:nucleotide-binding universal stress UspA family protein
MEDPSGILIATDGSKSSDRAADLGIKFARQYGAKVYAVYGKNVTAYDTVIIDEAWCTEALQEYDKEAHRATSSIVDKAKFAGLDAVPSILKGVVADEILNFADKHGVDLIVVGSHGRVGFERFALGSVSEKVVRHAKVPVLVVR